MSFNDFPRNQSENIKLAKHYLYILDMYSANGPELQVDAQHHHAGQEEGDAGGCDGVDGTEIQPTRCVFLK